MVCDLGFHFEFWLVDCVGSFVIFIRHSVVIRHSDFVISTLTLVTLLSFREVTAALVEAAESDVASVLLLVWLLALE